jgi:hypothetical protein
MRNATDRSGWLHTFIVCNVVAKSGRVHFGINVSVKSVRLVKPVAMGMRGKGTDTDQNEEMNSIVVRGLIFVRSIVNGSLIDR